MSDNPKPTKDKLLNELESIKDSLGNEGVAELNPDDNIPILVDTLANSDDLVMKTDEFFSPDDQPSSQAKTIEEITGDAEDFVREAYKDTIKDTQEVLEEQDQTTESNDITDKSFHFEFTDSAQEQDEKTSIASESQTPLPFGFDVQEQDVDFEQAITDIKKSSASTFEEFIEDKSKDDLPLPGQQSLFEANHDNGDDTGEPLDLMQHRDNDVIQTNENASVADSIRAQKEAMALKPSLQLEMASKKISEINDDEKLVGKGENPFLPQHIRDRLAANREILETDMRHPANSIFSTKHKSYEKKPPIETFETPVVGEDEQLATAKQQVIEEIVAEFLPKMEALLRERLEQTFTKDDDT